MSENLKEIVSILKSTEPSEETFVWLNINGQRERFAVVDLNVNEEFYLFTMELSGTAHKNLRPNNSCYLKLDYGGTVFKVNVIHIGNGVVTCQIPKQVYTIEKRSVSRTVLSIADDFRVSLSFSSEILADSLQEFSFRVRDYSKNGLGIVIGDDQFRLMKSNRNKDIYLSKIGNARLGEEVCAKLVFMKKIKFRYNGLIKKGYRIGFEFERPLSDESLDLFITSF